MKKERLNITFDDILRKIDEMVIVVRDNTHETELMRRLVTKEYRVLHDSMNRITSAMDTVAAIVRTEEIQTHVNEVEHKCRAVQRILQAQIIRSATLTEVTRFIRVEEPTLLKDCMNRLLDMYDEPDSWWEKRKLLAVWEWGAMLYPQHKFKWRTKYHIADVSSAKRAKKAKVVVQDDFDEATPIDEPVADELTVQ